MKKWILNKHDENEVKELMQKYSVSALTAAVLAGRKINLEEEGDVTSPFKLKDMDKAVKRVQEAVDSGEKITVYGDYDCDGITATALLYTYLLSIGAEADYYLPMREGEGYGLNNAAVFALYENGTNLIITVDNGISAIDEAEYIKSLGMDLVITDHHRAGERLPRAAAVVDPSRADDKSGLSILSGVGVAFKLAAALEGGDYTTVAEYYAELVAIGTIGDIVPLIGENRTLVRHGLAMLPHSENMGLRALADEAKIQLSPAVGAEQVAYGIVPRINAAGRMGNAELALRLLLSEDESEAEELAKELNSFNTKRRAIETKITLDAIAEIEADERVSNSRILVLRGEDWHLGVVGIVCSRILKKYSCPVFLMSMDGGLLKGSARGVKGFDVYEALGFCGEFLETCGGHKAAGGFSLKPENFEGFKAALEQYALNNYQSLSGIELTLDKQLEKSDINIEAIEELKRLEPYGAENEQPVFLIKNAVLTAVVPISGGKHQRLKLKFDGEIIDALMFGVSTGEFHYKSGMCLDLAVTLSVDEYNGKKQITAKTVDIRPANFDEQAFFAAQECGRRLALGEEISQKLLQSGMPTRDEAAAVYKLLKRLGGFNGSAEDLFLLIGEINYFKLLVILTALAQLGLIERTYGAIKLISTDQKVDLWSAPVFSRLKTV